jgi:hypothetical protein
MPIPGYKIIALIDAQFEALLGHLEDDMEMYDETEGASEYERLPLVREVIERLKEVYREA